MTDPNQSKGKPSWLSELQQKSWEPEILLSGIVLYGMFQVPELLDDFQAFVKLNVYSTFSDVETFIALLKMALYWLIFGLILHLVTRGIWVGMVGLSFVFPRGINKDNLNLSPRFKQNVDKIKVIDEIIIDLEKLCSSLFSISFMMFMMIIGGYTFLLIALIIPIISYLTYLGFDNISTTLEYVLQVYTFIIIGIAIIGLFDFLTLGLLKRIKWISKIYYPIHRLISFLTLASFYRPIYYTLISNYNKWKIGLSLVVFVIISILMIGKMSGSSAWPGESWSRITLWSNEKSVSNYSGYFDDQNADFYSTQAHIQSDIISENTVRLFCVLRIGLEESIKKHCDYESMIQSDTTESYVNLRCVSEFYQVVLDDILIDSLEWRFHYKQKTNQRGILTYLDVTDLPKGLHTIKVKGPDELYRNTFAEIPFYREISPIGYRSAPLLESNEEGSSYLQLKPVLPK